MYYSALSILLGIVIVGLCTGHMIAGGYSCIFIMQFEYCIISIYVNKSLSPGISNNRLSLSNGREMC